MKKSILNKKITARERIYYDVCDDINIKFEKEIKKLDIFRMFCVEKIFQLKYKDRTLLKYRKQKEKLE